MAGTPDSSRTEANTDSHRLQKQKPMTSRGPTVKEYFLRLVLKLDQDDFYRSVSQVLRQMLFIIGPLGNTNFCGNILVCTIGIVHPNSTFGQKYGHVRAMCVHDRLFTRAIFDPDNTHPVIPQIRLSNAQGLLQSRPSQKLLLRVALPLRMKYQLPYFLTCSDSPSII